MSHTGQEFPLVIREAEQAQQIAKLTKSISGLLVSTEGEERAPSGLVIPTTYGLAAVSIDRGGVGTVYGALVEDEHPDTLILENHKVVDGWLREQYPIDRWCGSGTLASDADVEHPDPEAVQTSLYYHMAGAWFMKHALEIIHAGVTENHDSPDTNPSLDGAARGVLQQFDGDHQFGHPGLIAATRAILQRGIVADIR